jgi:hypothetical protein
MYFVSHINHTAPFVQKKNKSVNAWINNGFLFSRKTTGQYSPKFLNIGADIKVEVTSHKLRYT